MCKKSCLGGRYEWGYWFCMEMTDDEIDRYARHLVLREIGGAGQAKLRAARVIVVGIGGLGAPLVQYLAAAGIGHLTLIDDDIVSLSNLQRQVIYRTEDVGKPKVDVAAAFIKSINPHVSVAVHQRRLDAENVETLTENHEIICDCSDNFTTRFLLAAANFNQKIPLVAAAIRGFEGQLSTWMPDGMSDDRPCYHCFNPVEDPETLGDDDCAATGILGAVAGVLGTMQAVEVMREIVGFGTGLAGRMVLVDLLSNRQRIVKVRRDPSCVLCGQAD